MEVGIVVEKSEKKMGGQDEYGGKRSGWRGKLHQVV